MSISNLKQQRKLKKLLLRPDLWRGKDRNGRMSRHASARGLSTGHIELDQSLIQQGWPLGGLIEITQQSLGMGEWHLLRPALCGLKQTPGYLMLLNPPEQPYAPALKALGLNLNEVLIIEPKNRSDAIAAFVESLRSNACKAILFWEARTKLKPQDMRRLQLAATGSQALCLLFRHPHVLKQSSPAVLRLKIKINTNKIQVQLLKQRGAFQHKEVHLDLPSAWRHLPALSSQEWLHTDTEVLPSARILPFNQQQ